MVIGDGPSVTRLNGSGLDSAGLATVFDGTVLSVAAGETPVSDVERAVEKLAEAGAPLLGAVLNDRGNPTLLSEFDRQFARLGWLGRRLRKAAMPILSRLIMPDERF